MIRHQRTVALQVFASSLPLYHVSVIGGQDLPYCEVAVFKYENKLVKYKMFGFIPREKVVRTWYENQIFEARFPTMKEAYARFIEVGDQLDHGDKSCLYSDDNAYANDNLK